MVFLVGIKARLIQNVIYTVGKRMKREENIISAIGGNKIERGRTKVWENQLLRIPAVPPTINNFGILSVLYNVQVFIEICVSYCFYFTDLVHGTKESKLILWYRWDLHSGFL